MANGEPDANSALIWSRSDTRKWIMLPGRVIASQAAGASFVVPINQARDDGDVASLDIAVKGEVVAGARVVTVGAAVASRANRTIAEEGKEIRHSRIAAERVLFFSARRTDQLPRRPATAKFLVVRHEDEVINRAMETEPRFIAEPKAGGRVQKVIADDATASLH